MSTTWWVKGSIGSPGRNAVLCLLWPLPYAFPLAMLLASIMTFGALGENYELVAMKSSGISLFRIMKPLIVIAAFITLLAFYFRQQYPYQYQPEIYNIECVSVKTATTRTGAAGRCFYQRN
jgi:hypothetical protein